MSDVDVKSSRSDLVEPLRVADIGFHVTKSIDQCPPGLQARELVMNGIEAEMLEEEKGVRVIRISTVVINEAPKLAIFNSGRGMTSDELIKCTDLASSLRKRQGMDGRENRGEGAKVSSLPWNHVGLRFRSCRQGLVSEAMLARVDGVYVRKREEVADKDGAISYDSAWDVTDEAQQEGYVNTCDWTEVVCLGNHAQQDTTRWPYGEDGGQGRRREVLTEIFDRFYSIPSHVHLEADESLHGRKGSTTFRLMKDVIAKWGSDSGKLRSERVPIKDGVKVEYVHTPMLSGGNTVMGAHELAGQPTRIALVWHGEMYDARIASDWRRIAAGFGLPHVHSVVSIFIHLPDDAPVRNGAYRVDLRSKENGEAIEVEDFQAEIRNAMPEWLRALVKDALQPRQVSDMSSVRRELERRLREARIRPSDMNRPGAQPSLNQNLGAGSRSITTLEPGMADGGVRATSSKRLQPIVTDPDAPSSPHTPAKTNGQQAGAVRRRRSIQTITSAPDIIWLDTQSQIEGEDLNDRVGKYDLATNALYLNGLYEAVQNKLSILEEQYAQQVDWEQIRELVTDKVRASMALHIGSIVVYALAKQGRPAWKDDDWKTAYLPQSLTVAADQSDYLLGDIRSGLAATGAFKAAKVI